MTSCWEGEEAVLERRLHGSYQIDQGTHLGDAYGMVGENVRWRLHLGIQFALLSVPLRWQEKYWSNDHRIPLERLSCVLSEGFMLSQTLDWKSIYLNKAF